MFATRPPSFLCLRTDFDHLCSFYVLQLHSSGLYFVIGDLCVSLERGTQGATYGMSLIPIANDHIEPEMPTLHAL
jgi:hypothetical protein